MWTAPNTEKNSGDQIWSETYKQIIFLGNGYQSLILYVAFGTTEAGEVGIWGTNNYLYGDIKMQFKC